MFSSFLPVVRISVIQVWASSSSTARRHLSFTVNEIFEHKPKKYMREVLGRTDGCSLYDPSNSVEKIISPKTVSDNPIIGNLESTVQKIYTGNRFNDMKFCKKLLTPLNDQCVKNYKSWPINEQLYALDVWHFVKNVHSFPFFEIMLSDVLSGLADMNNGPALQAVYYVAQFKRPLYATEEEILINKLQSNIRTSAATFGETSIYCLALFLNDVCNPDYRNNSNKLDLVKSLYTLLQNTDLQNHNGIGVSNVIKAVRRFSTFDHLPQMRALQSKLVPFAWKCDLICLTQIIQLGVEQRLFNDQLIDLILKRFLENLSALRDKDVERALLAISTFNRNRDKNHIENLFCDEVQKHLLMSLDSKFPSTLIRCTAYLAVLGVADKKLIEWALSPSTLPNIHAVERDLFLIDAHAKIDLNGSYTGPTLPESLCAKLIAKADIDRMARDKFDITDSIRKTFERNGLHCILARPFPYVRFPYLFIAYNKQTHKTIECFQPNDDGSILNPSDLNPMLQENNTELGAIAVISCSKRQMVRHTSHYSGFFQKQLDQLKMLGFKPIVIKSKIWTLYATPEEKRKYLFAVLSRHKVFLEPNQTVVKSENSSESK